MQDARTIVSDEEETIEDAKCDGVDREKVHRCNNFAVVLEKRFPPSDLVGVLWRPPYPTRNRSLGNIESKHLQFPVNPWVRPREILRCKAKQRLAKLVADVFS